MKNTNYYVEAFRKYAEFKGRANRPEYWYFVLFNFLVSIGLAIVESIFIGGGESSRSVLSDIYGLISLVPSIAVGIRRMHDIDKSGWFLLIPFYNIYLLAQKGNVGENRFGGESTTPASAEVTRPPSQSV